MKAWIVVIILMCGGLCLLPALRSEESLNPGNIYDSSMELYHKKRFQESLEGFSRVVQSFPNSKLVSYSEYMIGLCLLGMERFEEAGKQFQLYLNEFPGGDRVKEAEDGIRLSKEGLKKRTPIMQAPSTSDKTPAGSIPEKPAPGEERTKRRICSQVFNLDAKNLEEAEVKMRELKAAGVDTVIVKVFQNKGDRVYTFVTSRREEGVYFKTDHAPVVEDILGKLTELAHRNGLDLFAWMTTRYANYGLNAVSEYRCRSYQFGTKQIEPGQGFNLFHPDVLKRLEGLFRDLGRYPIDGILFQDDLILRHNEDFSPEANKLFLKETGIFPHPDLFYIGPYLSDSGKYYVKSYTELFWTWAKWKNHFLMDVAQRLMAAARESNPRLKFGINLYYEAVLSPRNAMAWFSQTLSGAAEKKFDYYAIMAYHRQTMRELKLDEGKAIQRMGDVAQQAIRAVGDPSKVLMKIQDLDWRNNEVLPRNEVEKILEKILAHGKVSLCFVPYVEGFPLRFVREKWMRGQESGSEQGDPRSRSGL